MVFDHSKKQIYFIEISCPTDITMALKEVEKLTKYRDLAADFHRMYGMQITNVPVVLGCTVIVSSA